MQSPYSNNPAKLYISAPDLHYGNKGTWNAWICEDTGHVFQYPVPGPEELESYYPKTYYAFQDGEFDMSAGWKKHPGLFSFLHYMKRYRGYDHLKVSGNFFWAMIYRVFLKKDMGVHDPVYVKGGNILDYGCGSGSVVAQLKYLGWNASGIELNGEACAVGIRHGLDIKQGATEQIAKFNSFFDVIRTTHTLEHVTDIDALVPAFYDALKPGGQLLIEIPNGNSMAISSFREYAYYLTLPVHINLFSPRSIRSLLEKNGFEKIRTTTYNNWATQALSFISRSRNGMSFDEARKTNKGTKLIAYLATFPMYMLSRLTNRGDCLLVQCRKKTA